MVTQMIETGEESGALDAMLEKVAEFYDNEVNATIESLTSVLEPLLIVTMGRLHRGHRHRDVPADVRHLQGDPEQRELGLMSDERQRRAGAANDRQERLLAFCTRR